MIVVSTDDDAIAAEAERSGASVVHRPPELADDTATSESALVHALDTLTADGVEADVLAFIQCTSPFIGGDELAGAIDAVTSGQADVAFAARETHEFIWTRQPDGSATGLNHDHRQRLRRQDRTPDWAETGAFYVMRVSGFRQHGHRFFGRVVPQPVDPAHAIEIDTPAELELARVLAGGESSAPALGPVQLLVTDFDGVHTDDRVWIAQDGTEMVVASRRDGHGVKLLRQLGVEVLIISTEENPVVARRAEKLKIECIHAVDDKWPLLKRLLDERGLDPAVVAFLGNDVNDVECIRNVGYGIATADAHPSARDVAQYVTVAAGGHGAVREVAELILADRTSGDQT